MYGTASVVCHFPFGKPLVKNTFFRCFPKKKRSHCESQKSGFGFDLKNPSRVWILWIHDPVLDLPKKTKNPFSDSEIRIWVFPKNAPLVEFDWEIWISDFAIEREIQKRIAPPRNPSSEWIEIKKSKSRFRGFTFYRSIGNPKKDLQNSGLLFANYTCACKTAVVKDSFSNPFLDFQSNGQKWKYKNRYLSVEISFRFPVRLQIRNPDFKSHIQISQSNAPYVRLWSDKARQLIQTAHRVSSLSQVGQKFDRPCRTERFCRTKLKLLYQINLDAALLPFHQLGSSQEWRASEPCIRQTSNRLLNTTHEKCPVGWWSLELTAPIDSQWTPKCWKMYF